MNPILPLLAALIAAPSSAERALSTLQEASGAQEQAAAPPAGQGAVVRKPKRADNVLSEAEVKQRLEGLFERIRLSDDINEYRTIYDSEVLPLIHSEYRHARKLLPEIHGKTTDHHTKLEIQRAIAEVPVLKLRLWLGDKPAVGKALDVRAEIRNVDAKAQWAVRSLDGSDVWETEDHHPPRRYPHFKVQIEGPDGQPIHLEPVSDDARPAGLRKEDFKRLAPEGQAGDRFDPFAGRDAFANQFLSGWTPQEPGRHILRLTVDYTSEKLKDWNCALECVDKELSGMFSQIPNVEFSETIVLDVAGRAH